MKLHVALVTLVILGGVGFGRVAGASPVVGQGLAESDACVNGTSCVSAVDFSLDPPTPTKTTTGSIDFVGMTAVISLFVPSYTMTGSSGSVTALDFTDVSYSATVPISITYPFGPGIASIVQDAGFATGSVSGTYAQVGGPGAALFSDMMVSFSGLNCLLFDGVGQCGLTVGGFASEDLALDVDGVDHDLVQVFNVIVPEPGTFGLVALGLLGIALHRRR